MINENRPAEATPSPPLSSLITPSYAYPKWTDNFCRVFSSQCGLIDVVDKKKKRNQRRRTARSLKKICQKTEKENVNDMELVLLRILKIVHGKVVVVDCHFDVLQSPSLDSLPWPALDRVFFHLFKNENCQDLFNLSQASPLFYYDVNEFMMKEKNRPSVKKVSLWHDEDGLHLTIDLYPSNLPFYGLSTLDKKRFELWGQSDDPHVKVTLNGAEDPIIDQVVGLLTGPIKEVRIEDPFGDLPVFTSADLSLAAQLLHGSTIKNLVILLETFDDSTISSIFDLVSHAKEFDLKLMCEMKLSDPATFFIKFLSMDLTRVLIIDHYSSSFFELPNSFWQILLNEKLANESFERVEIEVPLEDDEDSERCRLYRLTEATINIPADPHIISIEWNKAKAK